MEKTGVASRVTHVAQCVVFGAVMVDAAMLDAVLVLDVWGNTNVTLK